MIPGLYFSNIDWFDPDMYLDFDIGFLRFSRVASANAATIVPYLQPSTFNLVFYFHFLDVHLVFIVRFWRWCGPN